MITRLLSRSLTMIMVIIYFYLAIISVAPDLPWGKALSFALWGAIGCCYSALEAVDTRAIKAAWEALVAVWFITLCVLLYFGPSALIIWFVIHFITKY